MVDTIHNPLTTPSTDPPICLYCANFDAGQRPIARSRLYHSTQGGHLTIYGDCLLLSTPELVHIQTSSTNTCDQWTAYPPPPASEDAR